MERTRSGNLKEKSLWGLFGAIASALIASICCLGLLVLLALGITGAWIGNLTALAPYRPIFVIVTMGFLGLAFYGVYRRPKVETCPIEGPCATPGRKRRLKMILWIVTILILGLIVFPYFVAYVHAGNQGTAKMEVEKVVLEVKNMTCVSCTVAVKKSLARLDGVEEARVTLDPPEAVVVYAPAKVKVEDLIKITTNAGFPSSVKQKKEQ